ncbi:MAG: phosphatidate cytidylyltransferase [Clostridia bacterium]|nr:phosphatidate cytidylyltransferase [Clostridia bacterium]
MKTRVITALVGVPILIAALIIRGVVADVLIIALTLIALSECYKALAAAKYKVCKWGGYFAAIIMWPLSSFMGVLDPLLLVTAAMGISMLGVLLSKEPTFPNAAASIYPLFTCLMPFSMFMMMHSTMYGRVPGIALITMAFGIAYGCDIFAYLGGRTFGRHKLCPAVSPKKTVEGAVSGVLGAVMFALIIRAFFVHVLSTPMPGIPAAILLGVIGSVAGQVGDLTASMLKRYSGIKDYGKLFPGHGGVMDRFDSVIFTLIVMYCYTLVLH